jgi:hypothetical protein
MGLFGKVKKAAKKATKPVRSAVRSGATTAYRSAVKPASKTTYRSVLRPMGRSVGRSASRTYKSTAGRAIRSPNVSPRRAFRTASRIVGAPRRITQTLRGQTKKTRPRRGR